ncbi:fimbrial biogenesis chaperone [Citrobacter braakii]|uniref:fimbrial biogenesis chaperone n=1 Tax=Citrobacter braakii TaxID=57706 RepID=UPI00066A1513|nr:molecular chaperone [Citrobacter braakii]
MKFKSFSIAFLCCITFNTSAIQIYSNRIIYNENKKEVSFRVKNESTSDPYLVQAWVSTFNGESISKDFIVVPPLINLTPESANDLRIMYSSKHELPKDRESIYSFKILSIPAIKESNDAKVVVTTKLSLKLIYRPTGLNREDAKEAYKDLKGTKNGNLITISNPTPYYVSIKEASFDSENIEWQQFYEKISTLKPFSTVEIKSKSSKVRSISILAIDDYGATQKHLITFNGK